MSCTWCSNLAWYIAGLVWRLRESGSYSCGDVVPKNTSDEDWLKEITREDALWQFSSGNFMWIFYIISWIMMGVSCVAGCLTPCIVGACMRR